MLTLKKNWIILKGEAKKAHLKLLKCYQDYKINCKYKELLKVVNNDNN